MPSPQNPVLARPASSRLVGVRITARSLAGALVFPEGLFHSAPWPRAYNGAAASFDRDTDALVMTPRDAPIEESAEVRFEPLSASRVVEDVERVQFNVTGRP